MSDVLKTPFGNAKFYGKYYVITSRKEGNFNKQLHRLIYEKKYGKIPDGYVIHHKDRNRLNNNISNLEMMTISEHMKYHANTNHPRSMLGKKHTKETREKLSKVRKGVSHTESHKLELSKSQNSSGYFRVSKHKCKGCKQGFIWRYQWYVGDERKEIQSTSIKRLEEKVKSRGLKWEVLK